MRLLPLAIMLCACYCAWPQSSYTLIGARAQGLGYASSCLSDEWAILNNIGGLAKVDQITTSFTYDAQPQFKPFNRLAALFAVPTKIGVAGVSIFRFGDDLYNEQILSAGFSNTFGLASLGVKVNYIQYNTGGFGRYDAVTVSAGGIAQLTPQLFIGAHIVNINQPKISGSTERVPTVLMAGIAFQPIDKLFISSELEKDLDYDPTWKTGLEYQVHKKFVFRTGFNINPNAGFAGVGFKPSKFILDYAFQYASNTGPRHQATPNRSRCPNSSSSTSGMACRTYTASSQPPATPQGTSTISGALRSRDTDLMIGAVRTLGVTVDGDDTEL